MEKLFIIFMLMTAIACQQQSSMNIIKEWRQLDFLFPSPTIRADAINRKLFVPANVFTIDVDVDYQVPLDRTRIFVTTPRFSTGIPASLGFVSPRQGDLLIQPYPDYSWHSSHGTNCDGITSVVRVAIDACRQLWVLDTGVIAGAVKCPPQLLVFNLANDQLVKRYKFPSTQYTAKSLFITPVLDVKNPYSYCTDTKVYIADVTGFALIVYDSKTNKSWRIQNSLFNPNPTYSRFTIAGESFDLSDGIFGLAISPQWSTDDNRYLFFHSLASAEENAVTLSTINNPALWTNPNAQASAFRVIGQRGIQTPSQAMDCNGNLFFVLVNPLALVCWDSSTAYTRNNIKVVHRNDQTLQFASGLKIVRNTDGVEELWIMTNRFQKIAKGNMNFNEINFRILVRTISSLLMGNSKCYGTPLSSY